MSRFDLEGVVFDVDGVLFDTERLSQETWNAVSTELNWPQVGRAYLEFVGQNRADILQKMLDLFGPDFPRETFLLTCSARSQARMEQEGVPLKPGVREILEFLTARGIPAALATSTNRERTHRRMEMTVWGPASPPWSPATRWSTASRTRRSISWPAKPWGPLRPARWPSRTPATGSSPPTPPGCRWS